MAHAKKHQIRRFTSHQGFSLVEVLVSIVVLSFGLLGMVGMQAAALQANRDARLQSSAVRLAREAAELIRDNKNVGQATAAADNPFLLTYNGTAPTAATQNCFTATCTTPKNVADYSIKEWLSRAIVELPSVRVAICYDTQPFDTSGLPQWTCNNTGTVMVVKLGWTRTTTDRSATGSAAFDVAVRPSVVMPVTAGAGV